MSVRGGPRWRVAVQADPPSVQTWSVRAGFQILTASGHIELHHLSRRLPRERGVWIELQDNESGLSKAIHIDVGDRADPTTPRSRSADTTWARNWVPGAGRPLGLVAPMRSGFDIGPRYLLATTAGAFRNRRLTDLRALGSALRRPWPPRVETFERRPGGTPRVLYQVVSWDPRGSGDPEGRDRLNQGRAALINALRTAFGTRFAGGFVPTRHAREAFPHLLTNHPTDHRSYLELVATSRVVVGGIGLHDSIPWKLAEYLAASRGIVCERLRHPLPEPLDPVVRWFDDPDNCVIECERLLANHDDCDQLQADAHRYWAAYARPDRLLLRRLCEEFDRS